MSNIRQRTFNDKDDISNLYEALQLESDERQALSETLSDLLEDNNFIAPDVHDGRCTIDGGYVLHGKLCIVNMNLSAINSNVGQSASYQLLDNMPKPAIRSNSTVLTCFNNTDRTKTSKVTVSGTNLFITDVSANNTVYVNGIYITE